MCDALARNLPKLPEFLEVIVGHCLGHSRRRFVEVVSHFPQECRFVLETLGDLYMSLIHTGELNAANPFEYLIELRRHGEELAKNPAAWMPWNYRQTLLQPGMSKEPA
jgi:hypothetical protein